MRCITFLATLMAVGGICLGAASATAPATAPATVEVTVHVESVGGDEAHPSLAGATVTADLNNGEKPAPLVTAPNGTVHFSLPASAAHGFWIDARHPGFVRTSRRWSPDKPGQAPPADLTLRLSPGVNVGGKVVDGEGRPVAGAKVLLEVAREDRALGQYEGFNETLTTNAAGVWVARDLPETIGSGSVACYSLDAIDGAFFSMTEMHSIEDIRHWGVALRLERGVPMTVTVLDSAGKPAKGATLEVGNDWNVLNRFPPAPVDEAGRVTVGLKAGLSVPASVKAPGFAPQQLTLTAGESPQTVKLKAATPLTIRVVDKAGKPAAGARVFVRQWGPVQMMMELPMKEGRAEWTDAPAAGDGEILAEITAPNMVRQWNVPVIPGRENVVTLLPRALVKGEVVDAETQQPVAKFHVTEGIVWHAGEAAVWQRSGGLDSTVKHAAAGEFEYMPTYPGVALRVTADGYLPATIEPFQMDGTPRSFVFKMMRGAGVSGKVVDAAGKPVAHVTVYRTSTGLVMENARVNGGEEMMLDRATTADDGTFSIPAESEPFDLFVLDDTGYGVVSRKQIKAGEPVTLTVQRWGKVEGDVLLGAGHAAEGTVVRLEDEAEGTDDLFGRDLEQRTVRTDKQGHFVMDRLLPGQHRLVRMIDGPQGHAVAADPTDIQIVAEKTSHARLGGEGVAVVGKVNVAALKGAAFIGQVGVATKVAGPDDIIPPAVMQQGGQVTAAWWAAYVQTPEGRAWQAAVRNRFTSGAFVQADGSFRVENVVAGTYTISVQCDVAAPAEQPAAALGSARVEITVPPEPEGVATFDAGEVTITRGK